MYFMSSVPGSEEIWHIFYALYLLWVSGILGFYVLASHGREQIYELKQMGFGQIYELKQMDFGVVLFVWVAISVLAAAFGWPALLAAPFVLIAWGMPPGGAVVLLGFLIGALYLGGKLVQERYRRPATV